MKNIKVSIITVCYNSEKTIRKTIESVLNQTYKNIEYIIVDGDSTDQTIEIIKEYIPKGNGKIKYVSEKDKGIYNAFNKGLFMARGDLIGIINSDDYYESNAVQKVVSSMTNSPYQVIYGYCNSIKGDSKKVIKTNHRELERSMIPHPTCFVTRKTYCKYGVFIEWLKIAADYELMLRFYKAKNVKFIQIPEVLANFSFGGISTKNKSMRKIEIEKALIHYKYHLCSFSELVETLYINKFSKKYLYCKELSDNHLALFRLMENWVAIKQNGKNLSDFFEEKEYYNIAIYGMSYVGKRLAEELKESKINVCYGIDRDKALKYNNLKIFSLNEKLEKVDVIVVTAIYFYEEIENDIRTHVDYPIISLENVVNRIMIKYEIEGWK